MMKTLTKDWYLLLRHKSLLTPGKRRVNSVRKSASPGTSSNIPDQNTIVEQIKTSAGEIQQVT